MKQQRRTILRGKFGGNCDGTRNKPINNDGCNSWRPSTSSFVSPKRNLNPSSPLRFVNQILERANLLPLAHFQMRRGRQSDTLDERRRTFGDKIHALARDDGDPEAVPFIELMVDYFLARQMERTRSAILGAKHVAGAGRATPQTFAKGGGDGKAKPKAEVARANAPLKPSMAKADLLPSASLRMKFRKRRSDDTNINRASNAGTKKRS